MQRLQAPISAVLPDLFTTPRITTDPNSPLIYSGSLLHVSDIQMLPVDRNEVTRTTKTGIRLWAAFGSYRVLQSLVVLPSIKAYEFLWTPTHDSIVWIGSVSSDEGIDRLLSVFDATGFGAARVSGHGIQTLVTLEDMVDLMRKGVLSSELNAKAVSSELMSIPRDTMLADALQLMFKGKVRRLFLEDEPRRYVSDRSILAFLFSPFMLRVAKDTPAKWLDLSVNQLPRREAIQVLGEASVLEGARLLGQGSDDCLITDRNRVVSRWDLVIKTWKKDLKLAAAQIVKPTGRTKPPTSREADKHRRNELSA